MQWLFIKNYFSCLLYGPWDRKHQTYWQNWIFSQQDRPTMIKSSQRDHAIRLLKCHLFISWLRTSGIYTIYVPFSSTLKQAIYNIGNFWFSYFPSRFASLCLSSSDSTTELLSVHKQSDVRVHSQYISTPTTTTTQKPAHARMCVREREWGYVSTLFVCL